jgi:hypothetical protein
LIAETLDWDLSTVVPQDYIQLILQSILPSETDLAKIRLHVHILLSIAICGMISIFHIHIERSQCFRIKYLHNITECFMLCLYRSSYERSWYDEYLFNR